MIQIHSLVNRYYDPSTGQFISVDPLVDQTGQAYAYTGGDPVNGVDPLGLTDCGLNPFCYFGSAFDKTNNTINSGLNWVSKQVNTSYCLNSGGGGSGLLGGWLSAQAGCGSASSTNLVAAECSLGALNVQVQGLQNQIDQHVSKLQAYRADPLSYDNQGVLQKAMNEGNTDRAINIYESRIRSLQKQIRNFQRQIEDQGGEANVPQNTFDDPPVFPEG